MHTDSGEKERSDSVEERVSTNQHALIKIPSNDPVTTALPPAQPHCMTNTASNSAPYSWPIMTSTLDKGVNACSVPDLQSRHSGR